MRLLRVDLHRIGPFDQTVLRLTEPESFEPPPSTQAHSAREATSAAPRAVTVLFGGDGTGKTSLLSALALTRPGHALPPLPTLQREPRADAPPFVATEWLLGEDDPGRPHPLVVASPAAVFAGESAEAAALRRREQALFDRRAHAEGGHVFVSFSGARWFSRVASLLTVPERTILKYDVRQPTASFDDPTRADLTRETKQILANASVAAALAGGRAEFAPLTRFEAALRETLDVVLEPFDLSYAGASPLSLEPQARSGRGAIISFDALPRAAKHLVALVALPLRALSSAYPGSEAPREREGVVVIDDVESQQDPALLRMLVPLLRRALPNVQWILTTSSTQMALAVDPSSVLALRRSESRVELSEGLLH